VIRHPILRTQPVIKQSPDHPGKSLYRQNESGLFLPVWSNKPARDIADAHKAPSGIE
jgi:hypothetical protein